MPRSQPSRSREGWSPVIAAFVASVTCSAPFDRVHANHVSTVPKHRSRSRDGSYVSSSHCTFVADRFGASRSPSPRRTRHEPTVRRSCHPIPGPIGSPVVRSHTIVDAALVRDPDRVDGAGPFERGERDVERGAGEFRRVELHEPAGRRLRQHLARDVGRERRVVAHHRGPHPAGAGIDHEHLAHATAPARRFPSSVPPPCPPPLPHEYLNLAPPIWRSEVQSWGARRRWPPWWRALGDRSRPCEATER